MNRKFYTFLVGGAVTALAAFAATEIVGSGIVGNDSPKPEKYQPVIETAKAELSTDQKTVTIEANIAEEAHALVNGQWDMENWYPYPATDQLTYQVYDEQDVLVPGSEKVIYASDVYSFTFDAPEAAGEYKWKVVVHNASNIFNDKWTNTVTVRGEDVVVPNELYIYASQFAGVVEDPTMEKIADGIFEINVNLDEAGKGYSFSFTNGPMGTQNRRWYGPAANTGISADLAETPQQLGFEQQNAYGAQYTLPRDMGEVNVNVNFNTMKVTFTKVNEPSTIPTHLYMVYGNSGLTFDTFESKGNGVFEYVYDVQETTTRDIVFSDKVKGGLIYAPVTTTAVPELTEPWTGNFEPMTELSTFWTLPRDAGKVTITVDFSEYPYTVTFAGETVTPPAVETPETLWLRAPGQSGLVELKSTQPGIFVGNYNFDTYGNFYQFSFSENQSGTAGRWYQPERSLAISAALPQTVDFVQVNDANTNAKFWTIPQNLGELTFTVNFNDATVTIDHAEVVPVITPLTPEAPVWNPVTMTSGTLTAEAPTMGLMEGTIAPTALPTDADIVLTFYNDGNKIGETTVKPGKKGSIDVDFEPGTHNVTVVASYNGAESQASEAKVIVIVGESALPTSLWLRYNPIFASQTELVSTEPGVYVANYNFDVKAEGMGDGGYSFFFTSEPAGSDCNIYGPTTYAQFTAKDQSKECVQLAKLVNQYGIDKNLGEVSLTVNLNNYTLTIGEKVEIVVPEEPEIFQPKIDTATATLSEDQKKVTVEATIAKLVPAWINGAWSEAKYTYPADELITVTVYNEAGTSVEGTTKTIKANETYSVTFDAPTAAGTYKWRVLAKSANNADDQKWTNEVTVVVPTVEAPENLYIMASQYAGVITDAQMDKIADGVFELKVNFDSTHNYGFSFTDDPKYASTTRKWYGPAVSTAISATLEETPQVLDFEVQAEYGAQYVMPRDMGEVTVNVNFETMKVTISKENEPSTVPTHLYMVYANSGNAFDEFENKGNGVFEYVYDVQETTTRDIVFGDKVRGGLIYAPTATTVLPELTEPWTGNVEPMTELSTFWTLPRDAGKVTITVDFSKYPYTVTFAGPQQTPPAEVETPETLWLRIPGSMFNGLVELKSKKQGIFVGNYNFDTNGTVYQFAFSENETGTEGRWYQPAVNTPISAALPQTVNFVQVENPTTNARFWTLPQNLGEVTFTVNFNDATVTIDHAVEVPVIIPLTPEAPVWNPVTKTSGTLTATAPTMGLMEGAIAPTALPTDADIVLTFYLGEKELGKTTVKPGKKGTIDATFEVGTHHVTVVASYNDKYSENSAPTTIVIEGESALPTSLWLRYNTIFPSELELVTTAPGVYVGNWDFDEYAETLQDGAYEFSFSTEKTGSAGNWYGPTSDVRFTALGQSEECVEQAKPIYKYGIRAGFGKVSLTVNLNDNTLTIGEPVEIVVPPTYPEVLNIRIGTSSVRMPFVAKGEGIFDLNYNFDEMGSFFGYEFSLVDGNNQYYGPEENEGISADLVNTPQVLDFVALEKFGNKWTMPANMGMVTLVADFNNNTLTISKTPEEVLTPAAPAAVERVIEGFGWMQQDLLTTTAPTVGVNEDGEEVSLDTNADVIITFYNNGEVIGTDTVKPGEEAGMWTPTEPGDYSITATATYKGIEGPASEPALEFTVASYPEALYAVNAETNEVIGVGYGMMAPSNFNGAFAGYDGLKVVFVDAADYDEENDTFTVAEDAKVYGAASEEYAVVNTLKDEEEANMFAFEIAEAESIAEATPFVITDFQGKVYYSVDLATNEGMFVGETEELVNPATDVTATENEDGSVTVSWTAPDNDDPEYGEPMTKVESYTVVIKDAEGNVIATETVDGDATSVTFDDLDAEEGTYTVEVTATYGNGQEETTEPVSFKYSGIEVLFGADGAIYYDLTGNQVVNPANGIYVRIADGKASKVLIRK